MLTDGDPDERTSVDLSGLTDSERVLHTIISEIVSCETSVLDPDDSDILARVIVEQLPEVYKAAPELLKALQGLCEELHKGRRFSPRKDYSLLVADAAARTAIHKAGGESQ